MTQATAVVLEAAPVEAPNIAAAYPKKPPVGESIARGALALLSTQPITWAGTLLTTIALPRLMGAEALGQYTIAYTIATLAGTAFSLGVSEFLVRRTAQSPTTLRQDTGVALLVQMIPTTIGALFLLALAWSGVFTLVDPPLLSAALLILLATPAQTIMLSSYRGRELHAQYAWFNAGSVVSGQVLGFLILLAGHGVIAYTLMVGGSMIVSTLLAWRLSGIRPILPRRGPVLYRQCRDFIWGGLPFLTWMLTLAITSGADRVVLGWFVPAAEVGWYAAAFRIFGIPVFLPTLIMTPLFPALSRSVDSPEIIKRTISRTIRVVMLLMVPMTAGIIVVAPAVPSVLGWPADFDNAIPMMVILSLQLPIIAVDMVFGTVLLAIGRQGRWVTFGVLATVGKLVVDIAAIPIAEQMIGNGAVGASVVSLLAEFAMFGGAMWLTPKHLLDRHLVDHSVRVTVAGIATVLAGSALLPIGLAYAIVGGAVAYFGVAIALRAVTRDEIRILKEQMPGARRA